jgi:high-affinity Fe2+/Pb2+ permease
MRLGQLRLSNVLVLIIFVGAVLCAIITGYDLLKQTEGGQTMYILAGGYTGLILAMLFIVATRSLSVRNSLANIPKLYMPISSEDLPPVSESKQ